MQYNHLGKAGIKVSEVSFGSWVTFSKQMDVNGAKKCMHTAFEHGINFFDNAEVYAQGESEILMGQVLKDFRRESVVVSTKIFWGGKGPNDTGLSRKHLLEGTRNALKRLQLEYIDLIFCHRPDPETPIEETVLAMDYIVRSGQALYWGTSEWSARQITSAYEVAEKLGCIPPSMEQPEYNLFHRQRVECEYEPLYKKYGMGTTIWSPLASGVLTGKYNNGIPQDSRLAHENWLMPKDFEQRIEKVKRLMPIAQDLGCSIAQLAIAWCLKNPDVSTVILGASREQQLLENLKACEVKDKLSEEVMQRIEVAISDSVTA